MKTIVITSDKGGVEKSTWAALIIEWLNFNNVLVDLVDADPIQTTRIWSDNCASDGRIVLLNTTSEFRCWSNLVTKSRYYHCPISTSLYRYKNSSRLVSCYQFYITKKGNVCFKSFSKKQMNKKMVYYL